MRRLGATRGRTSKRAHTHPHCRADRRRDLARAPTPSTVPLSATPKKPHPTPKKTKKTDKLAATKAHDKEVHEAMQSRRAEEKGRRDAEKELEREADKYDRDALHPDSKAAKADARHAAQKEHKHERHEALGECEHKKKNCKICAPRHK